MHLWLVCYQLVTVLEISYDLKFPTYKNKLYTFESIRALCIYPCNYSTL